MSHLLSRVLKAAFILLALTAIAAADDYPGRPIRMIIPFPPGGSNDVVGRLVAKYLTEKIGQQVYVDNRAGAGGTIGTEACAQATPDGYTICVVSLAHAVNPALYANLHYDPIKSFTPITIFATGPNVLVVNPSSPFKSVKDLLAAAKEKPGELNYASAGVGSFQHLGAELFKLQAKVNLTHVPYKGGGPAMQDVVAGHVTIMFSSLVQTTPLIKSGQLPPSGTGGVKRSPVLPDVPTIAEAGVPGYHADNWWGLVTPAGLPQPIVEKLYKATQDALKAPELQAQFEREGAAGSRCVRPNSPTTSRPRSSNGVKWSRKATSQRSSVRAYRVPMRCSLSTVQTVSLAGVGMPSSRPNSRTLPDSQSSSMRLPRSRSCAIEAFMPRSTLLITKSMRPSITV